MPQVLASLHLGNPAALANLHQLVGPSLDLDSRGFPKHNKEELGSVSLLRLHLDKLRTKTRPVVLGSSQTNQPLAADSDSSLRAHLRSPKVNQQHHHLVNLRQLRRLHRRHHHLDNLRHRLHQQHHRLVKQHQQHQQRAHLVLLRPLRAHLSGSRLHSNPLLLQHRRRNSLLPQKLRRLASLVS